MNAFIRHSAREPSDVDCTFETSFRRQHVRTAISMPFLGAHPFSRRFAQLYLLLLRLVTSVLQRRIYDLAFQEAPVSIAQSTARLRVSPVDGCREETLDW